MQHQDKFVGEGFTYDDVLLLPAYSDILPREVDLSTFFFHRYSYEHPYCFCCNGYSYRTQTGYSYCAGGGGIGVLHKNMDIEKQGIEVKR